MEKKLVAVLFENNLKEYHFLTVEALELGNKVVVDTQSGLKIATVVRTRGISVTSASRWVVQKINTNAHEERLRKQEIVVEIKNKLRKRKDEMEDILIYQKLAKDDPEIKKLLEELGTTDNTFKAMLE